GDGSRNDHFFVVDDLVGQRTVFVGLLGLRIVFDDRHAADFSALHNVVTGHEVNHLSAQFLGQGDDQFVFTIGLPAIANETGEANAAGIGVLHDAFGDVVGRIHSHHLARANDVDF